MPPAKRLIAADEVNEMLRQGIIDPSNSPWFSSTVLVDKKMAHTDSVLTFAN